MSENDNYEDWLVEFGVQQIKEHAEGLEKGMEKLKVRATSLLGWVVSLSVASIAACWASAMHQYLILTATTMMATFLLIISSLFCIFVLYPRRWKYLEYDLDSINNYNLGSKIETLKMQTVTIHKANKQNVIHYNKTSYLMRTSWITFSLVPIVLALGGLFALCLNL